MAPMPRAVQVTWAKSRFTNAKTKLARPAKNTCQLVAANVGGPDCHFFDSTEPNAQLSAPPISATEYHSSFLPSSPVAVSFGHSRTRVPANPSPSPNNPRPETL